MTKSAQSVPVKVVYAKIGLARYLSHLDLNRVFQRSLRRSGLPIAFTKGFNPRIRISYTRALRLGKVSRREEMTVYLTEGVDSVLFKKRFQAELPAGIKLQTVKI